MKSFSQKITTIIAALAISVVALAQPTWNRVDYTATMAFIGEVRINQYDAAFPRMVQENDYIGAFVGNECRMIAKIVSFDSKLYVSSVIHGGDVFLAANSGELLEFKLWNSTTNTAEPTPIRGTLLSLPNDEILTYIIGKPNENAEVLSLEVANRSLSPAFSNAQKTYEIEFEAGAELPALSDVSLILADLRATYNVTLPTNFDDDNKLVVTVTAEDGTTKSIFTITCTQSACATPAPTVENNTLKFCVGDDAPALTATGTNLKWYEGETPLASAPTISTAAASNKAYFVTQTIGCESAKTRIDVVVNALPEVSISANKTEVLNTESLTLTLVPTTGGTLKGSDGVVGLTFDPSKSALGEQILTYSYIDANSCENSDEVKILVKNGKIEKPTLDNTTVNVLVNDPAPVLEANADGTITWYDKDKHKVGEGESFPTNIDTDGEGTYTYYVSNTVDGVESELVEITINVSNCTTPAPTVKNNILKFCVGDDAPALTATGTNLKWYDGETPLASAPTISTAAASNKAYFVTQTIGCESAKTRIDVTVNALPVVSISANKTEVLNTESLTLTLVPTTGGTLKGSDGVVGLTFDPSKSALGEQTLTYSYIDANSCENSDEVKILVKNGKIEKPTLDNTTVNVLVNDPAPVLEANADGTITWYDKDKHKVGEGESFPTNIDTNGEGTYTYYVSNTVDGVESELVEITINVSNCATPAPTVKNNILKFCVGGDASTLTATGTNLKWYEGGTHLASAPTISTVAVGSKTYFVTQTIGCESAKTRIDVTVNALPVVSISANKTEVLNTESLTLTLVPAAGGTLTGSSGVVGLMFNPALAPLGLQNLIYSYTDNNGCKNSDNTTITVKNGMVEMPIVPKTIYVLVVGDAVPTITAEGANLRWLNQVGTQVGSGNSFTPQISTNVAGNHQFTVVNTKDGVDSQPVPITIIVQSCAADKPTILTQRVNLCEGDKASSLADYAYGSNLKWYDGETLLPAAPTPNTGATGVKTYHVTQTTDCESPRAMITVEVFAKPTVSIFASANEVCTTEKLTIQLLPVGGNFSGPGTMLLSEFTPNPSAIGLQTLTYTYTDANKCSNTVSTTVTIKSCPVGPKPTAITIVDKPVLAISEAYLMQSKLTPADVVAQVHWSVNNPAIASIDRNTGVITGKSSGLVKVTAQLVDDKSISDYIIIRVVPQPVVTGVTVNSAGTEVSISFSEWIETPKNSVLFDIQIYNGTQEYIIYKATINRNNVLVLSLAEPIEDITNVKIKYVGTSISSMLGALVPAFEQPVIATSIAMIDNQVFTLYPTFAHDIVSIETSSEVDNIIVVNSQGQLILAQHATAPLTQISVAHLAQGNYSVVAFSKNQIVGTARFVKK